MILAFLLGAALMAFLSATHARDAIILVFGLALLASWVREANLHLLAERDRQCALERWNVWRAKGLVAA